MYAEKQVYERRIDQLEDVIDRLDLKIIELTEENRILRKLLADRANGVDKKGVNDGGTV